MARRLKTKSRQAERTRNAAPAATLSFPSPAQGWNVWALLQVAAIVLAGLWIHWPDLHGGWIGDDALYITHNSLLQDPARLWKAWFQPGSFIEYYPIHQTLQWLQWNLWHNDTFGYHLTNVLLHISSALLLWRLFQKLGLKLAWLGGLLFVVHPMTVDSVALINEFKTSLSLPPFLLAMMAWMVYEETKDRRHYLLALAFFVVAMFCKITMMTFPLIIPLYAWWKRGRIAWRDVAASLPFWVISVVLGYMSVYAGNVYEPMGKIYVPDALAGHPLTRFVLMGEVILFYIARVFFPSTPMTVYPQWHPDPAALLSYLPWLALLSVFAFSYLNRATWGRHVLLGLGFFLIMLAPFSGIHWISYMKVTWALEHLLYIPLIGLVGLTIAALETIHRQFSPRLRQASVAVVVVIVALLAWQSESYAANFAGQETLSRYVIRVNPTSSSGYIGLGQVLFQQGQYYQAKDVYEAFLKTDPTNPDAQNAYGETLQMTGNVPAAIEHFQRAVQLQPQKAQFHCDLATGYELLNRLPEALTEYQQAVALEPGQPLIPFDYAYCLDKLGRSSDAIEHYRQVVAIAPNLSNAHNALGLLLGKLGRKNEAVDQFHQSLQINANDPTALKALAALQADSGTP